MRTKATYLRSGQATYLKSSINMAIIPIDIEDEVLEKARRKCGIAKYQLAEFIESDKEIQQYIVRYRTFERATPDQLAD